MKKHTRIERNLGRGRQAVRCVDGRWRVFEFRSVELDGEAIRRWVCVHVEGQVGRWPYEFFGAEPPKKVAA